MLDRRLIQIIAAASWADSLLPMEYTPGDIPLVMVEYECLNVFGSRTGITEHVTWGEPSPTTPVCFAWRRVAPMLFFPVGVIHGIGVWLGGW
jgi:hypothetical protein